MENNTLVKIQNVTVAYDREVVLEDVSLSVYENDFIGVIGPNGSGKTTLIKTMLGNLTPLRGKVDYKKRIKIGYLPQMHHLDQRFPIAVHEVIDSGLMIIKGMGKGQRELMVSQAIENFHLEKIKNKPIGQISGGQRQKVLLARAVVSNPELLILDEPDTYIDSDSETELYEHLKTLNQHMAIVLVSHDLGMISSYVKSIACVNKNLYHHHDNEISEETLKAYNCPIDLITHGHVPHRVLKNH